MKCQKVRRKHIHEWTWVSQFQNEPNLPSKRRMKCQKESQQLVDVNVLMKWKSKIDENLFSF